MAKESVVDVSTFVADHFDYLCLITRKLKILGFAPNSFATKPPYTLLVDKSGPLCYSSLRDQTSETPRRIPSTPLLDPRYQLLLFQPGAFVVIGSTIKFRAIIDVSDHLLATYIPCVSAEQTKDLR
uniref:Uncharacterized protein n=1 Tax=Helianthus annuus TaxID=4232 RepID=A0A251TSM8_HELAN